MKAENKNILDTNLKAVKLISNLRKWLIPSIVLNSLFENLSPYVNIYMSAEIVNELSAARDTRRLLHLVLFTVTADLLIAIIGGLVKKLKEYEWQSFEYTEKHMFMEFGFKMDYSHLENPEILQRRKKIDESKNINYFGIWSLLYSLQLVTENTIKIILSVCFTSSLLTHILMQPYHVSGAVIYPAAILLLIILSVFVSVKCFKMVSKRANEISNTMLKINRISHGFPSAYQMGKDVRIYNMSGIFRKQREASIMANKEGFRKFARASRNAAIPDKIISQGLNFTIYAFVCLNALRGVFEAGSFIKYVGFITKLVNAVKGLLNSIINFKMNQPFLTHYLNFFETENAMYRGTIPVEKRVDNDYEIEFHDVSFKYPGAEHYALKNLSMKLHIGQRMAVVGMNGSGKTTMIKLLCRLYDPVEGMITLNGIDIKKYDYEEYMSIFSVVFQDFKLFSFTLGQNIAAAVKYDAPKAQQYLTMAGFGGRLDSMPNRLETTLYKDFEPDGVEISGGEAQKIALARALYRDAPFIVLDEPTAALDPIAEYEIYSRFNEIVGDKTAIYISHRLSSCRFCDDIAVFHEGEMIQRGSHDTLIADQNGKYYELWHAQAQYYDDKLQRHTA